MGVRAATLQMNCCRWKFSRVTLLIKLTICNDDGADFGKLHIAYTFLITCYKYISYFILQIYIWQGISQLLRLANRRGHLYDRMIIELSGSVHVIHTHARVH